MPISNNSISNSTIQTPHRQEIFAQKPGFLSRWFLLIFIFILFVFVLLTWFIKYPDVVKTRATIVAVNGPKEIIPRQSGRLIKLFVSNGSLVKADDIIGFIESTADHQQVLNLKQDLDQASKSVMNEDIQSIRHLVTRAYDQLGELQPDYQDFIGSYTNYLDYISSGYYLQKVASIKKEVKSLEMVARNLESHKELIQQDIHLSEDVYGMNEKLIREKVISKLDDKYEQSKLVNKKMMLPQVNSNILQNESAIKVKEREIAELEHSISQQKSLFVQKIQNFLSRIRQWTNLYVLLSPINGTLDFVFPLQENSYLSANKILGFVSPSSESYFAEAALPQANFGKIKSGQKVLLSFEAFPSSEFGFVSGRLDYITDFATDSGFLARISLPKGLFTNHGNRLTYRSGLKAEARIVTKDLRLLERFTNGFQTIFNR